MGRVLVSFSLWLSFVHEGLSPAMVKGAHMDKRDKSKKDDINADCVGISMCGIGHDPCVIRSTKSISCMLWKPPKKCKAQWTQNRIKYM